MYSNFYMGCQYESRGLVLVLKSPPSTPNLVMFVESAIRSLNVGGERGRGRGKAIYWCQAIILATRSTPSSLPLPIEREASM